jgi:tRNA-2-methylthio-N6-dimethylallyladenosine synthase
MYSERPGTPSSHLSDDVDAKVKLARCNQLLELQLVHQAAAYQALHGSLQQVLIEGTSRSNDQMLHGRSIGNLNIVLPRNSADGTSRDGLIGQIRDIRIERSTSLTLYGDLA